MKTIPDHLLADQGNLNVLLDSERAFLRVIDRHLAGRSDERAALHLFTLRRLVVDAIKETKARVNPDGEAGLDAAA